MPTTTGMKGGGYYDANSKAQRAAMEPFLPWLEASIERLPAPSQGQDCYRFLDIGSSEGANTVFAIKRLIRALRRVSSLPIQVGFDDLPSNDFNRLFLNLFPQGRLELAAEEIYACAVAGTAFGRLVPAGSLQLATTFNAIGFLNEKPKADLPNFILPMAPGPHAPRRGVDVTDQDLIPFRTQAASDLKAFYTARAAELVSGGQLLVQVFGRRGELSTSHGIYDVLSDALLDAVEQGRLPQVVYEQLLFPIYFRSLEELLAPLQPGAEHEDCFEVLQAEAQEVVVPFNQQWELDGDVNAWARQYTGFMRAFTEAILAAALPENLPQAEILEWIYERIEQRLMTTPERYAFHYISIGALLKRL
ncbi:cyclopropane-fatty-acyl-phospholipid synthase [Synechococcus sp. CBW1107]|uniref:cyclopropane-fatty-acyl-phospholipid synthase n=1 Tax=Synechococcus sp. CBW1107 TaxID=2789857 RepID=UPI002AD46ED1|nr:cyclopropane-fatty-acyl-phospholipid synthase [Synechococcus sp. CBW1107]